MSKKVLREMHLDLMPLDISFYLLKTLNYSNKLKAGCLIAEEHNDRQYSSWH